MSEEMKKKFSLRKRKGKLVGGMKESKRGASKCKRVCVGGWVSESSSVTLRINVRKREGRRGKGKEKRGQGASSLSHSRISFLFVSSLVWRPPDILIISLGHGGRRAGRQAASKRDEDNSNAVRHSCRSLRLSICCTGPFRLLSILPAPARPPVRPPAPGLPPPLFLSFFCASLSCMSHGGICVPLAGS